MKKLIYFVTLVLMASCSPYSNLKNMQSMRKDLEYPFKVKYAALSENMELAYVDEGKGAETIIFIHGLGSYLPAWKKNIEDLKSDFRVIAVDLPGYGKSTKNPHSGMMSFYAKVIVNLMDYLNIESAVIGGHSMGGQIAMVMALQYPHRINKLVLVSPAGFERFTNGQREWFRQVMTLQSVKNTTVSAIETNLAYNFYELPEDAIFMITDRIAMRTAEDFDNYCYAVARSTHGMVDEPVIDKLKGIHQPVLILFAENDNLIPNRYLNPGTTKAIANIGHDKLPNSTLQMIPKCGHFAQFEAADVVNQSIRDFLKP